MGWLNFVLEGARTYMDVRAAQDKVALEENNRDAQIAANRASATLQDANAQIATWQAADALTRGSAEVRNASLRTVTLKGRQVVAAASSGADISSGSIVNLLADTDAFGAEEADTLKHNADREAWAFRMQAMDSRNRAEILRHSKVAVASDSGAAVTAALVNGAARTYDRSQR